MTSMTRQYSSAASRARSAVDKTADFWTQGARTLTDRLPALPQIDLIPAVERYFDFVQGTVDINRRLTIKWLGAAGTLSEMVRDRAESAGSLVREKAESAGDIVRDKAEWPSGPHASRPRRPSRPRRSGHASPLRRAPAGQAGS